MNEIVAEWVDKKEDGRVAVKATQIARALIRRKLGLF